MSTMPPDAADPFGVPTQARPSGGIDGWVLRLVLAVAAVALTVLSLTGAKTAVSLTSAAGVVAAVLIIVTVVAPGSMAPMVLVLGAVVGLMLTGTGEVDGRVAALAALLALVHQLAGICAAVPATGTLDPAALRPALWRYLAAVGVVEIGILVWMLVR